MIRSLLFSGALFAAISFSACKDKEEIKVYRVSKEAAEAVAPDNSAMASMPVPVQTEKPQIKWEVPAAWKSVPASSMRYASFAVAGANGGAGDISITVFPGDTGGDLANVNRWRGQIGLQPVDTDGLKPLVAPVKAKDADVFTVDMTGASSRILAGWMHDDERTWFFKLTGPDALVGAEKENFVKFLESLQFKP